MKVAVIQGGPSTEAEVSRASGAAVENALVEAGHEPKRLELGPELAAELAGGAFDVAFPVTHGSLGEDGCLQGFLEVMGMPYVGSDVQGSAVAADKVATKALFQKAGIPMATQVVVHRDEDVEFEALRRVLGPEVIVKPAAGGSTIGIQRLLAEASNEDLLRALAAAHRLNEVALVETYVWGKELTCAVLEGDDGPEALPPTLIEAQAAEWYDFESKYKAGGSNHMCPAPFEHSMLERIRRLSEAAHVAVGLRDLSRTDFILSERGDLVALEVNTLPGMTATSLYPEAAAAGGISFSQLTDRLVRRAAARPTAYQDEARAAGRQIPVT